MQDLTTKMLRLNDICSSAGKPVQLGAAVS